MRVLCTCNTQEITCTEAETMAEKSDKHWQTAHHQHSHHPQRERETETEEWEELSVDPISRQTMDLQKAVENAWDLSQRTTWNAMSRLPPSLSIFFGHTAKMFVYKQCVYHTVNWSSCLIFGFCFASHLAVLATKQVKVYCVLLVAKKKINKMQLQSKWPI